MSNDVLNPYSPTVPRHPDPNTIDLSTGGAKDYITIPGPPILIPPAIAAIVVDSNGQQWQYWGGAWH